jgi:hypothetical protein
MRRRPVTRKLFVVIHTHIHGEQCLPVMSDHYLSTEEMIQVIEMWGSRYDPDADMVNYGGWHRISDLPVIPSAEDLEGGNHE